jgi:hypothetical protein
MATDKIPIPKPGEGEPIVFFDITLGGKSFHTTLAKGNSASRFKEGHALAIAQLPHPTYIMHP